MLRSTFIIISLVSVFKAQVWNSCGNFGTNQPSLTSDCTQFNTVSNLCCLVKSVNNTRSCQQFTNNATFANLAGIMYSGAQTGTIDCGSANDNTFFGVPYCGTSSSSTNQTQCLSNASTSNNCCFLSAFYNAGPFKSNNMTACLATNSYFTATKLSQSLFTYSTSNLTCSNSIYITPNINFQNPNGANPVPQNSAGYLCLSLFVLAALVLIL